MPSSDGAQRPFSLARAGLRLAIFLLPFLVGWAVLEWWMVQLPTSHSVKRKQFEAMKGQIDTLILGSSSAYWDIAPEELPGTVYNLANVAQTPYYDDQLATQALDQMPKLRRVIIGMPYVSMFFQLPGTDEEERQYYYFQEWNIPPPGWRERLDIRMVSRVALRTPSFSVISLGKALVRKLKGGPFEPDPLESPIDAHGWSARETGDPKDLSPAAVEKKITYHHGLMRFSNEPDNLRDLTHLVAELRARKIEVIVVTPPVWREYRMRMRSDFWQHAQTDFESLSRQYGVRYVSFLEAPELGSTDFLDADHLNGGGAIRFTRMLRAAITDVPHSAELAAAAPVRQ